MTRAEAVTKASAVFKLKQTLADDALDVGLMIVAPDGKRFPGRLVWDVAYSAGFRWGDGDYFHWVPSADTDVGQGIGMGTSTGSTYFVPEWITKHDGSADVDDLDMSFNVARAWQPEALFDVMVRAAHYMARRLGGTVVSRDGTPFDEHSARTRVQSVVKAMSATGLTPGSGLALRVF
jgi:cell division protein ZipA